MRICSSSPTNLNVRDGCFNRHPRIEVIVAGGAVRRADGAVIGFDRHQP